MARIRSIKPEFWSSPGLVELEPMWRLLYIAMWNWADDHGRGTCEPRELMGFAFPLDEKMTVGEFRRGLDGIRRVFGVIFYRVSGRHYFEIPSWEKHQKVDKRAKVSRYPSPDEGEVVSPINWQVIDVSEFSPEYSEFSPECSGESPGIPALEQGNRGTGEQGNIDPLVRNEKKRETKSSRTVYPEEFEKFWSAVPAEKKRGKKAALGQWRKAVAAVPNETLVAAMVSQAEFHRRQKGTVKWLKDPERWLRDERWLDVLVPDSEASKPVNDLDMFLAEYATGQNHAPASPPAAKQPKIYTGVPKRELNPANRHTGQQLETYNLPPEPDPIEPPPDYDEEPPQ